jgi:peptidoglycan/LPS O-acetylase OafA/YrhL
MTMLALVLAQVRLLLSEYVRLAWLTLYAAPSISNIYFFHHLVYFDAAAGTEILLHKWSLGVEEQFYLAFALFVLAITSYVPKWLNAGIGLLWVGSFARSAVGAFAAPEATFYLRPASAWELLLGILLVHQSWTATLHGPTRNLMALIGLALVGFSIIAHTVEMPFPGARLGTALIIATGPDRCPSTAPGGSPLEFDTDNLTREGSLLVIRKWIETGRLW